MVDAVERRGSHWRHQYIPFGVDNQSFQKSADKGWSRADRLTLLLKRLFVLQLRFDCLLKFFWLSTDENYLADHLSRGRPEAFLAAVELGEACHYGVAPPVLVLPPLVREGFLHRGDDVRVSITSQARAVFAGVAFN